MEGRSTTGFALSCYEVTDGDSKVEDSYGDKNGDNKGDWHGFRHDDWVISTGGGHHVCHDIHMMKNVRSIEPVTVAVMSGDRLTASVAGEVELHGGPLVLKNVLYISEYRVNILSVGALLDAGGLSVQFGSGKALIQDTETNRTICVGKLVNGLSVIRK